MALWGTGWVLPWDPLPCMPAMFPEPLSGRAVLPTACLCEGVVARLAAVTLVPHHSWLTGAPAIAVTLSAQGT